MEAGDIVLPARGSSTTPAVCALCLSAPWRYTCPRCNAPYCSLPCYRGARHSACSELFYRDSVLQALRDEDAGSRGRRDIEEMLLKLKDQEEALEGATTEEEDEESTGLWSSLTRQEKEHFNSLLQSGHIGALIPQWKPWWDAPKRANIMEIPGNSQGDTKHQQEVITTPKQVTHSPEEVLKMAPPVVNERKDDLARQSACKEEVSAKDDDREDTEDSLKNDDPSVEDPPAASEIPPVLPSIPPLSTLTRNPSPLVRFTLVNVIYSYSFSLLRHNGDLGDEDIMLDFIGTLLSVSGALSTTIVYNSTVHALKSAVRAASDPLLGGDEGVAVVAMEATAKILLGDGGNRYTLAALSHLHRLLGKIRKLVTDEKDLRKGAFNARKKCLFLAAWVNENGDHLAVLSAEVMMEYKEYVKDLNEMSQLSRGLERVWGGKRPPPKQKLIEEVN